MTISIVTDIFSLPKFEEMVEPGPEPNLNVRAKRFCLNP